MTTVDPGSIVRFAPARLAVLLASSLVVGACGAQATATAPASTGITAASSPVAGASMLSASPSVAQSVASPAATSASVAPSVDRSAGPSAVAASGAAASSASATPSAQTPPPSVGHSTAPVATPAADTPPPKGGTKAEQEIARLRGVLASYPDDGSAYRDLGLAFLQRVRETGDPSLYVNADEAFGRARVLLGDDPLVLVGIGTLQLARHEFAKALATSDLALKGRSVFPAAQAVKVDALVELGRYDEAVVAVQRMVDERPDLTSFARVSYVRELYGDLQGALDAMKQAETAGANAPENVAFVRVLRGNLQAYLGDRAAAATAYEGALVLFPGYAPAIAAQARLAVAAGDYETAIARFTDAAAIVPLPEYVIALGEANEAAGNATAARQSYDLARAETRLFKANGVVVDLELALFEADHGDAAAALNLAQAAYAERRTIRTADALAWAQLKAGNVAEATRLSGEALRLGTQDPLLLYHAGAIAAAAGDGATARKHLKRALAIDAGFSATGAAAARALLVKLG
jgi:tetratricopeptide (TPR) repeat protein